MTADVTRIPLRTRINGREHALDIEPQASLAEVLRDRLHLTGTKVSCDVQVCGACTVLVDGLPASGWRNRQVSCTRYSAHLSRSTPSSAAFARLACC
jgi:aerobic-type carbon monoxide dehydrogenase small subunit (CoxS/CutS family)